MNGCLALELCAPMQSWGTASRAGRRDTALEPSKSAVIGMLAAAQGRTRDMPLDDLAKLNMTVRVDQEGEVIEDYQTIGAGYDNDPVWPGGELYTAGDKMKKGKFSTMQSYRLYLSDAAFLAVLTGKLDTLDECFRALRSAQFQLALGRRSCPPGQPLAPCAPSPVALDEVLARYPRIRPGTSPLRVVRELPASQMAHADEIPPDQPLGNLADRRFGPRPIRHATTTAPIA